MSMTSTTNDQNNEETDPRGPLRVMKPTVLDALEKETERTLTTYKPFLGEVLIPKETQEWSVLPVIGPSVATPTDQ